MHLRDLAKLAFKFFVGVAFRHRKDKERSVKYRYGNKNFCGVQVFPNFVPQFKESTVSRFRLIFSFKKRRK